MAEAIHQKEDGWYFWDETWSDPYGPYPTREKAEEELDNYCDFLDRRSAGMPMPGIFYSWTRVGKVILIFLACIFGFVIPWVYGWIKIIDRIF